MPKTLMNNLESTKKRALRILGNRNFSENEMQKRLTSKGETPENAVEAVKWLVELGYINDSDYATLIVRHYSAKGYGIMRIRDELLKRGIPRDLWEEKLTGLDDSEMSDAALEFLQKKLRGSENKDDLRRASDALVRRGYSYDDARAAINRYLEESGKQNEKRGDEGYD
jgi:regulatory protein